MPTLAPVGTSAVILPMDDTKKWIFKTTQNDELVAKRVVAHMVQHHIKSVGFIGLSDVYGETWFRVMKTLLDKAGIQIVASERFKRSDTSVTGQALQLLNSKPDAVFIAATGGSTVLPQSTLKTMNYRGAFYQTHGAALEGFLRLGGKNVEGTIVPGSILLSPEQAPDSNPAKKIALKYTDAYKKLYGEAPPTFGGNVYDAGLLLTRAIPEALRAAKPGTEDFRVELRRALEAIKEMAGTQGVYNMTPDDHSGFDERGVELFTVENGNWKLIR